ncbi:MULTISPECIES: universal stress protein [unclassified Haladaptatus]|uniref:universal stress protein n=1 Tax=unclassified Haladaptatus TaxID=2622732 RepID=UPI0023E7B082|nr:MULTISPECIES: universal stress protein [unclassified Haladaptatus]
MYAHIVVAVDGSEEAKRAARRAFELADRFAATVTALHVVEHKRLRLTTSEPEKARLRALGEDILADIKALASDLDHPVQTAMREGTPGDEISKFADEEGADLLVVGRQGLTGLGERLLGGVAERVIHQSDVPVLVVPEEGMDGAWEVSRLLITTDGSENAADATDHGIAIAERYDAAIHVLNVVDLQSAGGLFDAGGLEREFVERLEAEGQTAVDEIESSVHESAPDLDVMAEVVTQTTFEGVGAGIRAYVEENDIGLVVMGSHGRSNLRRQLLGSVASTVLRTVDVPVLVVKREE